MKFSMALVAAVASVASAAGSADLISQIPSCALECIQTAESQAGCSAGDYSCSCSKLSELTPVATECLLKGACESNVILQLPGLISNICSAVSSEGGSGSGSSAAGSSAAATSEAAASTAAASSEAPATTDGAAASNTNLTPLVSSTFGTAAPSGSVAGTGSPAATTTGAAVVDSGAERIGAAGLALAAAVAMAL